MALLRWTVFNFLIGNADAHAKNLAMIFTDRGPRLAPFYDLICTQVYPDLAEKLAMRIGGENRPSWIQRRHWERFGDSVAIKSILVLKILRDMSAALMPTAQTLSIDFTNSYGPCAIIEKILTVFRQRTNAL
jgi:serine/threonine-protein kinase HipA